MFSLSINSKYYSIDDINTIKAAPTSSFNIIHTNIASIDKHFEELSLTLSLLDVKFDLIGITEHKIKKYIEPLKNSDLHGYSPFLNQLTDTTHGGAGFYINNNLDFKERKDLNLNSTGNFETIFIELIIPNRKNVVAGCIYRHPSSIIPTTQFTTEYLDPILNIITHENKTSVIVSDFNIDLLKYDGDNHANEFYNTMTSNFYSPFIL